MTVTMKLPVRYSKLKTSKKQEVRMEYIRRQEGKCFYCQGSLWEEPPENILSKEINWSLFPKHFLRYPIHLQHNHKTDMTEGAVHSYCNAVMWQYHGR